MKELTMRTLLALMLTLFIASVTTGCNTMEGAGEDMQAAGEKVEDTAEDAAD